MSEFEPVRFGKYLILDRIAVGGMAELFLAKITSVEGFEKLLAIKKILPHLAEDQNLVNMFIDEAKLAAMLTHQNIVQIYDLGSMEGTYYMAMEYIHGKDLRTVINKAREKGLLLPLEYALYIICRVCAGLDYSHNFNDFYGNPLKIIHRDISPQNVLVTYEGEVKIVDFGIVKAAKRTSDTKIGIIKGKAAYMSPEQASGKTVDHRSDIFSTGILLYEMVTGKRMFLGSDLQVMERVRQADFEPPEMLIADLPPKMYEIQHRALARDPELRYQSCAEMRNDLEQCLAQVSVRTSAELLAHYMKNLFEMEIAAEVTAVQKGEEHTPYVGPDEIPADKTETFNRISGEPSPAPVPTPSSAPKRPRIWLSALGVALAIIAVIVTLALQDGSAPVPGKHDEAATGKPTGVLPTVTAASSPARSPEMQQAMGALQNEEFALAVGLFEDALSRSPADLNEMAIPYAQALLGKAVGLMDTEPEKAEALLHRAVEVDPGNARAHFYLGKTYTSTKDYPGAIQAYRKALDLDPRFPDTFFNLGYVYTATRDYPQAEMMFGKAIELEPPYLDEAYFNLAVVQNLQGKSEECKRNLERALEFNPENAKAKKYLLRLKGTSRHRNGIQKSSHKSPLAAATLAALGPFRLRHG